MDYVKKYKFGSDVSPVFIDKILPLVQRKKVLDLGSGQGDYLQFFGQGSLGLDLSPKNLESARKKGLRVKQADFNNLDQPVGKFEVVFASHILEHVESPVEFLRFAKRSLKAKGILIVSVPNELSFAHLKYPYFTGDGNHLYSFTINNIKEILGNMGFRILSIHLDYYTVITSKLKLNWLLPGLNLLPSPLRTPFAWAYWFVCSQVGI